MSSTITLSEHVYELLTQKARVVRQTPDALAENLLQRSLSIDTQQWREAFDALISRVHARTSRFSSEEIEEDITTAAAEAEELRRARPS